MNLFKELFSSKSGELKSIIELVNIYEGPTLTNITINFHPTNVGRCLDDIRKAY